MDSVFTILQVVGDSWRFFNFRRRLWKKIFQLYGHCQREISKIRLGGLDKRHERWTFMLFSWTRVGWPFLVTRKLLEFSEFSDSLQGIHWIQWNKNWSKKLFATCCIFSHWKLSSFIRTLIREILQERKAKMKISLRKHCLNLLSSKWVGNSNFKV